MAVFPAAAQLESLTQREALAGLRAALERGAQSAVATLGRVDGLFGNPQGQIPPPGALPRTARLARPARVLQEGGGAGTGVVLATRGDEVRRGPGADGSTRLTAPLTVRVKA